MQKEILYKYKDSVSDYQQKDQAIYNVEMQNPDLKQISKLTKDTVSFTIPQLNINYCNSFNENFDITIEYQPIEIYDLNLFITGTHEDVNGDYEQGYPTQWNLMLNNDGNGVYTYNRPAVEYDAPTTIVQGFSGIHYDRQIEFRFDSTYTGSTITPKPHTFSLQQQSINSLISELNYPLKHIPYGQDPNNPVYHMIKQNDGYTYKTQIIGEIDISNQIFWDTYNGKLRFNYNGIIIDASTWYPICMGQWWSGGGVPHGGTGGYNDNIKIDSAQYTQNYGNLQYMPLFGFTDDNGNQLKSYNSIWTFNQGGTVTYNYTQATLDTYDLMNNIQKKSETNIYVKQLDSSQENYIFQLNNFYYANQLAGFMQSPQQIFDFLYHYVPGQTPDHYSMTFYPQTQYNNYHVKLFSYDDTNKYLKNVCAKFYLSSVNSADGFDRYINRQVCLSKEFFLQIWREVYVMSPQLQSNTILYKPENIIYKRQLRYTNTNNANGNHYVNKDKTDAPYLFNDKLNCICYYVNSVSFNNYVSLQNNYTLQYDYDQKFEVEALRSLTFILTDENGIVLPRLSEFKVYLQFAENQNNAAQSKTTNFNRVLTGDN